MVIVTTCQLSNGRVDDESGVVEHGGHESHLQWGHVRQEGQHLIHVVVSLLIGGECWCYGWFFGCFANAALWLL